MKNNSLKTLAVHAPPVHLNGSGGSSSSNNNNSGCVLCSSFLAFTKSDHG
jgi:hypothetical protein